MRPMVRGTVLIQSDRCKGCQLCVHFCPQQVLHLADHYNNHGYHPVVLDESTHLCTGCAVCAIVCPDSVFTVYRESKAMACEGGKRKGASHAEGVVEWQRSAGRSRDPRRR